MILPKRLLLLLLITGIGFLELYGYDFYKQQDDTLAYKKNPNYIQQIGLYNVYKNKHADIVMLGNSITHGVDWKELLNRTDVTGMGITSDVIEGFISRLNYIYRLHPKVCFIMGGINDIYNWTPVEKIFQEYVFLVKQLQAKNINVVIQSTLFVASKWPGADDRNKEVRKLNSALVDFSKRNNIEYLDLNSLMSKNDYLQDSLTYDGVHLNGKGYKIWGREVETVLARLGL